MHSIVFIWKISTQLCVSYLRRKFWMPLLCGVQMKMIFMVGKMPVGEQELREHHYFKIGWKILNSCYLLCASLSFPSQYYKWWASNHSLSLRWHWWFCTGLAWYSIRHVFFPGKCMRLICGFIPSSYLSGLSWPVKSFMFSVHLMFGAVGCCSYKTQICAYFPRWFQQWRSWSVTCYPRGLDIMLAYQLQFSRYLY